MIPTDLNSFLEEDAEASRIVPVDEDLSQIQKLVDLQLQCEEDLRIKQEALEAATSALRQVQEVDLPNAIQKFNISELKLTNGAKLTIKTDIHAGITEVNKPAAFSWLAETNNDGIIKNEVKLAFGKGQDAEAQKLTTMLEVAGYTFTNNKSVHPQTLKAFVKRRLESGAPIPTDVFSIHETKKAIITQPRKA